MKRPVPASNFRSVELATLDDLRRVRQTQKEILDWIDYQLENATGGVESFNGRTGAVVPQSGDYTPALVGLGNVTDDAQLKRAGDDWSGFTSQTGANGGDKLLIERASDSDKRVITANSFALPTDRAGFPYLCKPLSPDSWNLETRDWTDPDLANNGWTITLLDTPWTVQTRAGDIDLNSDPSANTYRSTLRHGMLHLQFPPGTFVLIYKAVTTAAFTYALCARATINLASNSNTVTIALADNVQRKATNARTYFTSMEATTQIEGTLVGPGTFNLYINGAPDNNRFDTIKYLHYTASGNQVAADSREPYNGRVILNMSFTARTFSLTPTICGIYMGSGAREVFHLDYLRRYPLWTRIP